MGWFSDSLTKLKDATASEPVQCPRGWGEVPFNAKGPPLPPFFSVSRVCRIGGVEHCGDCGHPFNPHAVEALRESLSQLESLQREGTLSEAESAIRRRMVVEFGRDRPEEGLRIARMLVELERDRPGEGFRIAAWVVGTLGVVVTVSGLWLAYFAKFWAWIAIAGGVMLAVSVSLAVVSGSRRENDTSLD